MKTKASASASASTSAKYANSHSMKQRVSRKRLELCAPETQLAIVVYTGGGEPIAVRKKMKSCNPRKPREKIDNGPNPPPGIPNEFKDEIERLGGTDWRLILQKGLSKTDLSRSHNRLSMPSSHWIVDQALCSELLMMFDVEFGNSGQNFVHVPLIDTKMRVWKYVSLRRWKMTKGMVVISGEWNDVVDANDLKVKDVVQIWCFKFIETGRFGLAMVKIEGGGNGSDIGSSDSHITLCLGPSNSSVVGPSNSIQPQASNLAGSSAYANQYPSVAYFDFMNADGDKCNNHDEHVVTVQIAGCSESLDNGRRDRSSTEAALLTVTDSSTPDVDLSLHL